MSEEGLRPLAPRMSVDVLSEPLAPSLPGVPGRVPTLPVAGTWPLATALSGWVMEQVVPVRGPPLWGILHVRSPYLPARGS